jgi:hypothetical protein
MTDDEQKVVPIGRAALLRASALSSDKPADGFEELAREVVGVRTFVAERGRVHGKTAWRIRIEGTAEIIDFFDPVTHRETFASLVGTDPAALDDWLSGRAFVRKPAPDS